MQLERQVSSSLERWTLELAILFLLAALYLPAIAHWYDGWLNKNISLEHEYFSHGIIGLPFAAWICWHKRHEWVRLGDRFHPLGALLLVAGASAYLSGFPDLINLSLPILLAGFCFTLKGIEGFRRFWFPWLLVFLATPNDLPYLIAPYTLPLQSFIAGTAAFFLDQFGIDVTVQQIYLKLDDGIVEVAPHCAGLKMLFTSLYVAMMLLYWTGLGVSRAHTISFLSATAAISVSANILRNTLLAFFHGTGREWWFHWLHEGWGGDLYSAGALGVLVILIQAMEKYLPPTAPIAEDLELSTED